MYIFHDGWSVTRAVAVLVVDLDTQAVAVRDRLANTCAAGRGCDRHRSRARGISFWDKLGTPHTIVPLPRHLSAASAHAVHLDAVGSWRNIDNGPVFCRAIPCLAHAAPRVDFSGDVISLVRVIRTRRRHGAGTLMVMLYVDLQAVPIAPDNDLVIIKRWSPGWCDWSRSWP